MREIELLKTCKYIAGIDEAGRGPLAGPVVAGCVILDPKKIGSYRSGKKWWRLARDSKLMTPKQRQYLVKLIRYNSLAFGIGISSCEHIDKINIHNASLRAMQHAILWCGIDPDIVLIDGKYEIKNLSCKQEAIVHGDARILSIALASIIAKTSRDAIMENFHKIYPEYEFHKHKGYATPIHRAMIEKYGPSPIHRKSFLVKLTKIY